MSNPYDNFAPIADPAAAAPAPSPYDQFPAVKNEPVMQARTDDGSLKGDNILSRIFRTTDNFMRSVANNGTFGLADKGISAITGNDEEAISSAARLSDPGADVAGRIVGTGANAILGGRFVSTVLPGLAGAGIPAQMGNQAIVAGGSSVIDDVAHGSVPDPLKAAAAATGAAAAAPVIMGGARMLSPTARFRASGNDLTVAEKDAATAAAKRASDLGIPYSVPEAVAAGAPRNAARVDALANSSANAPQGSQVWANFEAGRPPLVQQAGRKLASDMLPGSAPVGLPVQQGAEGAIKSAKQMVSDSAELSYAKGNNAFGIKAPKTVAIDEAKEAAVKDKILMGEIGKAPPSSLKFLDIVKEKMGEAFEDATKKGAGRKAGIIARDKDALNRSMEKNPHFAEGNATYGAGQEQLIKPLEAGPLGVMSKTTAPGAQGDALFGVGTAAERDAAINAAKRLPAGQPQGLMAHRVEDIANRDPMGLGKITPTAEGKAVVDAVLPGQAQALDDLQTVVRGMSPKNVKPHEMNADGPVAEAWGRLKGYGSERIAKMMQDPAFIEQLGKLGYGQKAGLVVSNVMSQLTADEMLPPLTIRKKRSER